jgi:hypothetical protein
LRNEKNCGFRKSDFGLKKRGKIADFKTSQRSTKSEIQIPHSEIMIIVT